MPQDLDPAVIQAVSLALLPLMARHDARGLQLAVAYVAGSMASVASRTALYADRDAAIEAAVGALSAGLVAEMAGHLRRAAPAGQA